MKVSERARALLQRGTRYPRPSDRAQIIEHFERALLPPYDSVVAFQQRFGGVEYAVGDLDDRRITFDVLLPMRDSTFRAFGFRAKDQEGFASDDERVFYGCARHASIQLTIYLDQFGVLYVDDGVPGRPPLAIASCVEKHIGSDALLDEIFRFQPRWYVSGLGVVAADDTHFDERMSSLALPRIPEATDAYTRWWGSETLRVCRQVEWSPRDPRHRILAHGKTPGDLQRTIEAARGATIVGKGSLRITHPAEFERDWGGDGQQAE